MMKKIIKKTLYFVIFLVLAISLTGCSEKNGDKVLNEKILSELSYLDTKLIEMLNDANGLSLENYIVKAEKISEDETGKDASSGGNSDSQGTTQESSGTSSEAGGQSGSSGSTQTQGNEGQSNNNVNYIMEGNEILLQDRTPEWTSVKTEIEKLYADWSTIVLDLYAANVSSADILSFNLDLDLATQAIKKEDKKQALTNLAKLYSYIPKYVSNISNNSIATNLYQTKSNILNAYAAIEKDDFEVVKNELLYAEQSFLPILNNMNSKSNNQSSLNKVYISIKELQNSIQNKDKDIFYIKYKNLIQEIKSIKIN